MLAMDVTVEEKLDGTNLGISKNQFGNLQIQMRGQYLSRPYTGQFSRLNEWLKFNEEPLRLMLKPGMILFGEWCAARHSTHYSELPDWFIVFDIYDKISRCFWSTTRRDDFANLCGLHVATVIFQGTTTLEKLTHLVLKTKSRYADEPVEGLVIRSEDFRFLRARAKLVHPNFLQSIDTHWRNRKLERNRCIGGI